MTPGKDTVDFIPSGTGSRGEKNPNIKRLIGAVFLVTGFEVYTSKPKDDKPSYEYAIIQTNVGSYRTATQDLIHQLREMEPMLNAGKTVRVKLTISEGYISFGTP